MVNETVTSIGVKIKTKERLQRIGRMDESFDDLLNRMCEIQEQIKHDCELDRIIENPKSTNKERSAAIEKIGTRL